MDHLTGDQQPAPPVVDLLAASWRAVREVLENAPPTGMRWRRPARKCADWCRKDHTCTAQSGAPGGEHRSRTAVWTPPYGRLHITRVQAIEGQDYLSLGASVRLDPDVRVAMSQVTHVPIAVNLAIMTALDELAWLTPRLEPAHRRISSR